MSNMLPARIVRVWLVDARGSAVEQKAKPKPLSSGQRHYMYRLGLMAVDRFLKERGFRPNIEESNNRLSYEKRGVLIDVAVVKPDRIAYVTSYPGYEYQQEVVGRTVDNQERYRVGVKVVTAKEAMGCDYVVQIMVSTNDAQGTRSPVFVPLHKDLENPARHVVTNVLGTLAMACDRIQKLQDAFTQQEVEKAEALPLDLKVDDSFIPLLPE